MQLKTGDRIGDYEVLGVLGAGGMGSVYKVRNTISDRVEALKLLLPNLVEHPDLKERFLREIKTSASLEHPAIAGLRTAFQSGDMLLMVMEFVDGQTLDARLRQGSLQIAEAVRITASVLDALEFAHSRGVVHRDIKPANVMLANNGGVKLLDFGIAKATTDKQITVAGTTMGSLYYMSPEQIRGEHVDGRGDLYSLGITLYELTTGKRPFGGESGYAIMAEHLQKQPVPPIEIAPHVPPALSAVILRSLAKQPGHRYQSAAEFRRDLLSVLSPEDATQILGRTSERQSASAVAPVPTAPAMAAPTPASPGAEATLPPAASPLPPSAQQPFPVQPPPMQPAPIQQPPAQYSASQPHHGPSQPHHGHIAPAAPQSTPAPASMSSAQPRKPGNALALLMVALIALFVLGAVVLVFAGSWFFASEDPALASTKPSLVQRIGSLFSGSSSRTSDASSSRELDTRAQERAAGEADSADSRDAAGSSQASALSAANGDLATAQPETPGQQGFDGPGSSQFTGYSPVPGKPTSRNGVVVVTPSRVTPAQPVEDAGPRASLQQPPAASTIAPEPRPEALAQYAQPPAPPSPSEPSPRQLEAARDFISKLGIRAGTVQESARKLSQEQSSMGVSLRADMRAALKRMEYLMDQAEAALDRGNLDQANQHMQGAEREIEKLEKFFRI